MRTSRRLLLAASLTFCATSVAQLGPVAHIGAPPPQGPASTSKDAQGNLRVSGGVMAGQLTKKVTPVTPPCSRGGMVVLHAVIGTDGKVEKVTLMSGPHDPDFIKAVMDATRQWEYKPYLLNGKPVRVDTTITNVVDTNRSSCPAGGL